MPRDSHLGPCQEDRWQGPTMLRRNANLPQTPTPVPTPALTHPLTPLTTEMDSARQPRNASKRDKPREHPEPAILAAVNGA
jgi:hypothetical protein